MPQPEKSPQKNSDHQLQNRDNQCLRWELRASPFPPKDGMIVSRPSRYPTDGLKFTGIDFPTPVSQINKLKKQTLQLAVNVLGWEKERVIVKWPSERGKITENRPDVDTE